MSRSNKPAQPGGNSRRAKGLIRELARDLMALAASGATRRRMARELGVSLGLVIQVLNLIGEELHSERPPGASEHAQDMG